MPDMLTGTSSSFAEAGVGLTAFGQYLRGAGYQQFGQESAAASAYAAEQARQAASSALATGTRQAYDVQLQGKYIASKALAVAAGTGGGASDPTVMAIQARTAGETAYRTSVAIYGGESRARALGIQAAGEDWQGQEAKVHGNAAASGSLVDSLSTVMRGGVSLYEKYGKKDDPNAAMSPDVYTGD